MKIAYVLNGYPAVSETFITTQIIGLIDAGNEIDIFSNFLYPGPYHEDFTEYSLLNRIHLFKPRSRFKVIYDILRIVVLYPTNIFKLLRFIYVSYQNERVLFSNVYYYAYRLDQYDAVHCHFAFSTKIVVMAKKMGLLKKVKFVTSFHGSDIFPATANMKDFPDLSRYCDIYTLPANFYYDLVVKEGFSKNKIRILPCGCNTYFFANPLKEYNLECPLRLIFVGRLIEFKAPDLLIEICRKLVEHIDFRCTIIGGGELEEKCRNLIDQYQLQDKVLLTGAKDNWFILQCYMDADLFVFPGIYDSVGRAENQGVVAQEAQAMCLPVICSDAGGTKESVIDGVTGWVMKEKDIDSFVEKICFINNNRNLLEKMGKAGREHVQKNYDNKIVVKRLISIYNE